jgi:hypothetical protein
MTIPSIETSIIMGELNQNLRCNKEHMYASVGIHHPKGPDEQKMLLRSMRQLGEAMNKHDGLIVTLAIKDPDAGMLIGIAVWKSKEDFEAAWKELSISEPKRREAQGFRFGDYEDEPNKFYSGEEPV